MNQVKAGTPKVQIGAQVRSGKTQFQTPLPSEGYCIFQVRHLVADGGSRLIAKHRSFGPVNQIFPDEGAAWPDKRA
jgi:hypothetical protein